MAVFEDFIGQSIVLSHSPSEVLALLEPPPPGGGGAAGVTDEVVPAEGGSEEARCPPDATLLSVYAHLHAAEGIVAGRTLATSDVIGTVAPAKNRPGACPAHLHLSLVWAREHAPPPDSWRDLCSERFRLIRLPAP